MENEKQYLSLGLKKISSKKSIFYLWTLFIVLQLFLSQNSYSQPELKYIDSAKAIVKANEFNSKLLEYSDKIIELNSSSPWGYIYKAEYLYWIFQTDTALKYVDIARTYDINNSYAYHLRARIKIRRGENRKHDCADAIFDLKMAKKLDSTNYLIYNTIAYYYETCIWNLDEAKRAYDKSLFLKPMQPNTYYNRASTKHSLGDTLGAINDYSSAIKLDSKMYAYYDERGKLYYQLRQYEKAYGDFDRGIKLGGNHISLVGRGMASYYLKKYKNAVDDLSLALESLGKTTGLDGFSFYSWSAPNALFFRGLANYKLNKNAQACNDWKEATSMGDERAFKFLIDYCDESASKVVDDLYFNEKYDLAIKYLDILKERKSSSKYVINMLANCYYVKQDYQKSLNYYKEYLKIDSAYFEAKFYGGISAFYTENYEDAKKLLVGIEAEDNQTNFTLQYYKGITYYFINEVDSSISCLETIVTNDKTKEYFDANWYLGQIYHEKLNFEKSIQYFSTLINNEANENEVYYYRGLSYYFNSEFDKAISDFSTQIEIDNGNGLYFLYRGLSYKSLVSDKSI